MLVTTKSCCCQNLKFFSHQHQHRWCVVFLVSSSLRTSLIVRQVSMPFAWNASIVSQAAADCVAAVQALRSTLIRRMALALKPEKWTTRFHMLHLEFGESKNSFFNTKIILQTFNSSVFFRFPPPFTFQIWKNTCVIIWPCHFRGSHPFFWVTASPHRYELSPGDHLLEVLEAHGPVRLRQRQHRCRRAADIVAHFLQKGHA